MNITEEMMEEWGYVEHFKRHEMTLRRIFGDSEYICSFDTYQFDRSLRINFQKVL